VIDEYLDSVAALVELRSSADRELAGLARASAAKEERESAAHKALEQRLKKSQQRLSQLLEQARSNQIRIEAGPVYDYAGGPDPLPLLEQINERLREALEAAIHTHASALAERERVRLEQEKREAEELRRKQEQAARAAKARQRDRTLRISLAAAAVASILGGLMIKSVAGLVVPLLAALINCYLAGEQDNTLTAEAAAVARASRDHAGRATPVWPWFAVIVAGCLFGVYGLAAIAGAVGAASFGVGLGVAAACGAAVIVARLRPST
jgi:DNA repair exonuclease SbcCD ATPase subunit